MNKYLKWLLYGCLIFSFCQLVTPSGGKLLDILGRGIPGLLALTTAVYLRKYILAFLAIVVLSLNMAMVYIYPKYVTPTVERRATARRSALEKEKYFGHLGDEAKKYIMSQSKDIAAQRIVEFADICLIKQDFVAGYKFLDEKTKLGISVEQFKNNIINLHSGIFPESIEATDYEPILGREAMKIFLCGKRDDKKFYYMITAEMIYKRTEVGTVVMERDYKISDVELSLNPYPDSELRHSLKN